mmetsp:Transcript_10198/g.22117  ORF Transcript_10198/g.22117 Transcript_10198/m.22117 type:complete len:208 (-) Transcript_10198:196-819(-)
MLWAAHRSPVSTSSARSTNLQRTYSLTLGSSLNICAVCVPFRIALRSESARELGAVSMHAVRADAMVSREAAAARAAVVTSMSIATMSVATGAAAVDVTATIAVVAAATAAIECEDSSSEGRATSDSIWPASCTACSTPHALIPALRTSPSCSSCSDGSASHSKAFSVRRQRSAASARDRSDVNERHLSGIAAAAACTLRVAACAID